MVAGPLLSRLCGVCARATPKKYANKEERGKEEGAQEKEGRKNFIRCHTHTEQRFGKQHNVVFGTARAWLASKHSKQISQIRKVPTQKKNQNLKKQTPSALSTSTSLSPPLSPLHLSLSLDLSLHLSLLPPSLRLSLSRPLSPTLSLLLTHAHTVHSIWETWEPMILGSGKHWIRCTARCERM